MPEMTMETFYIINQIPKINRAHWNLPWMSCILKFRSLKISLETLERSFLRGEKTEICREASWDIWNSRPPIWFFRAPPDNYCTVPNCTCTKNEKNFRQTDCVFKKACHNSGSLIFHKLIKLKHTIFPSGQNGLHIFIFICTRKHVNQKNVNM